MNRHQFSTDSELRSIVRRGVGEAPYSEASDSKTTGLSLRVGKSGVATWYVRIRLAGRQRRIKLGRYPGTDLKNARVLAANWHTKAHQGATYDEVQSEMDRKTRTVSDLIDRIDAERWCYLKRPDFHREICRIHIRPALGAHPLSSITLSDCRKLIRTIGKKGHIQRARHVQTVLNTILCYGVDELAWLERNPLQNKAHEFAKRPSRTRILSELELGELLKWLHAGLENHVTRQAIFFCLLTAQRREEVSKMRWEHIDLVTETWTKPEGTTKNSSLHVLPLPNAAMSFLHRLGPRESGYVFQAKNARRRPRGISSSSMSRAISRKSQNKEKDRYTLHDLRRTCATWVSTHHGPSYSEVIRCILNHKNDPFNATHIYNRNLYLSEMRDALDRWCDHLYTASDGLSTNEVTKRANDDHSRGVQHASNKQADALAITS